MNRVSWDSTAPRRLGRKRGEQRRGDNSHVPAESELIWHVLARQHRI